VDRRPLEWIATVLLEQPPAAHSRSPDAIWFLLHAYAEYGIAAAREHVEVGLTCALEAVHEERDACRRIAWLELLTDAGSVTDDPRLVDGVRDALAPAIDSLESFVGHAYEPGEGLLKKTCVEQLRCANALLSAFQLSGRLPYAMLAEELVQVARRRWWKTGHRAFVDEPPGSADAGFQANCFGAQALCRLAALHGDSDYRAAAVLAPHATHSADARSILMSLCESASEHPACAALLGRALLAWFALDPNLQ
jgi:hypothetical protein